MIEFVNLESQDLPLIDNNIPEVVNLESQDLPTVDYKPIEVETTEDTDSICVSSQCSSPFKCNEEYFKVENLRNLNLSNNIIKFQIFQLTI